MKVNSEVGRLTGLLDSPERFDLGHAQISGAQIAAASERFRERVGQIDLLAHQAKSANIREIREPADLVPLLFAHSTYKSYPESWLITEKWGRLQRWLDTISTYPTPEIDVAGVEDIDDWLHRLAAAGTYVSCSSGTTGKCSMIAASSADRNFSKHNSAMAFQWGTGLPPSKDFKIMGVVPIPVSPRNNDVRAALSENYGNGNDFAFPGVAITIGQISRMVALRHQVASGVAAPQDIADYERIADERQAGIDGGMKQTIDALVENREQKLLISGQLGLLFQMTEKIREMGLRGKDFHPDNAMFLGGGPKGAVLPENWRDVLMETYNVPFSRVFQYYGMQEINTTMPRCGAGRYHVPPWLILLLLDEPGERLVDVSDGEAEGRAGFFDLSLDGRWGGVISGDRISVRYGKCDCGHEGPTIGSDIVRYSDLGDGDKITCAGTIDAYVRGVS